jgi:hypothetical protein
MQLRLQPFVLATRQQAGGTAGCLLRSEPPRPPHGLQPLLSITLDTLLRMRRHAAPANAPTCRCCRNSAANNPSPDAHAGGAVESPAHGLCTRSA